YRRGELDRIGPRIAQRLHFARPAGFAAPAAAQPRLELDALAVRRELDGMLGEAAARLRPSAPELQAGRQDEVACLDAESTLRLLEVSAQRAICAQRPAQLAEEVLDAR